MFRAHYRADSQLAHHPYYFHGHVRAIRPVAQVLRQAFLAAVDGGFDSDLRHLPHSTGWVPDHVAAVWLQLALAAVSLSR